MDSGLQVFPENELKFRCNFTSWDVRKQIPTTMSLKNPTDMQIAFKVKTTSPKRYSVRPSSGVVNPKETIEVQVAMQAQKDTPTDISNCKDKFLVQSVFIQKGVEPDQVSNDLFDRTNNKVIEKKLRVVLEAPNSPPSPVPEENSIVSQEVNEKNLSEINNRKQNPQQLIQQNKDLEFQVKKLQMQLKDRGVASTSQQDKSFSIVHIALTAIIAFIIGYYLGW